MDEPSLCELDFRYCLSYPLRILVDNIGDIFKVSVLVFIVLLAYIFLKKIKINMRTIILTPFAVILASTLILSIFRISRNVSVLGYINLDAIRCEIEHDNIFYAECLDRSARSSVYKSITTADVKKVYAICNILKKDSVYDLEGDCERHICDYIEDYVPNTNSETVKEKQKLCIESYNRYFSKTNLP
ncbi:hypothetical protein A2862_01565 [Candidatus Roizmanbacteria bacterium RIFCSPHIGHO2_01_FULL_38_41]|uniref:Uncharacterized protein n=1 Tax=Candidatus Roizmanbacteria bacterium RIFCSPHIGHO2_02_FULL_37_24 TaxID=1802037 RepID=A0A1F7GVJ0_9BACT|nr:MAG: hypothetical protein A2862_01565 [Candidatus Roizmanbacteria bacterium RIFCSPHIGHO2_01_FULL_38_41]OGK22893.1 MAG: hypothetical protein A3C24_03445 [Candidatus Roizmanbacteria bacterium RIFCSPHIGHO2_02_FULL_37_24]OGK32448.1 MAG: hypothetical protein A3E10_03950 [Candidatus Roizmanbacteria bacterium RIFCSPHIGHO2_12_FULL_37_23]OGK44623.1 MAG: hypothetical protein A2956_03860 [Candidatus Roizmanbacteria bacterium RIFCSPLOWO2_01_FULL_37_57]OGK58939.1 MAG: hypothetical protein A3G65_04320 [Ca